MSPRFLLYVCTPALTSCVLLSSLTERAGYSTTWHERWSNADDHPSAPLYHAAGGSHVPLLEVQFPPGSEQPPRRMLLDTGARFTSISRELADSLELQTHLQSDAEGREHPMVVLPPMTLGQLQLERVPAEVVEHLAVVGDAHEVVEVDGALGLDVWGQVVVDIDSGRGTLQVHPSGTPLEGIPLQLGADPGILLAAGSVGAAPPPPGAPHLGPREAKPTINQNLGVPDDAGWAPMVARTEVLEENIIDDEPPAIPVDLSLLPRGGPHLLRLATGQEATRVHPEVLPWAGGDGLITRQLVPEVAPLEEVILADLLDELPRAGRLQEITRYTLPFLSIGSLTVSELGLDLGTQSWSDGYVAAVIGADVLGELALALDLKHHKAALRPIAGGRHTVPVSERVTQLAEAALGSANGPYKALAEGLEGFIQAGRWPEAAQVATRMVERNPNAVQAYVVLARRAERQEDWSNGASLYERLGKLKGGALASAVGTARLALLQNDPQAALLALNRATPAEPGHRARIWRLRGQALLAQEQFGDATQAFKQALKDGFEDAGAHRGLAWIEYRAGDLEAALDHLQALLRLTPGDDWAQSLAITIFRRDGDETRIDTWLDDLEARLPNPPVDGWNPLAHLHVRLARERNQPERMNKILYREMDALDQALSHTTLPLVQAQLLRAKAKLKWAARQDLPGALKLTEQAMSLDPYGRAGASVRVAILKALGHPDAKAAADAAYRAAPLDLAIWLNVQGFDVPEPPPRVSQAKPPKKAPTRGRATVLPRK